MSNQSSALIYKDLFSYDIVSCYPTILNEINYDFKDVDLSNKTERNIFIGMEQKDNEILSSYLTQSTESLIKFYLQENNIQDDEIITTQKDGFILSKKLENTDEFIEIKLREYIDFLIFSIDRKKFLYSSDGEIKVKGIAYSYDTLNPIYQKFNNLNFYDKKKLFLQLEDIKNIVLKSEDKKLFLIPKDGKSFLVSTYKGNLEISNENLISLDLINKQKYFDHYFKEFVQSIFLTFY